MRRTHTARTAHDEDLLRHAAVFVDADWLRRVKTDSDRRRVLADANELIQQLETRDDGEWWKE